MAKDKEPKKLFNPAERAELDQSVALISDYSANVTGRFFNNLVNDHGISRPEALTMTVAFIANNFGTNNRDK